MADVIFLANEIMKKVKDKSWKDYPIGTKAFSIGGRFWPKVERGWKWCTGDTFPTPGADAYWVEEPSEI